MRESASRRCAVLFLARAPAATCRRRSKTSTRSTSRSACATSTSRGISRIRPAIRSSSRSARRRPACSARPASATRSPRRSRCWSALAGAALIPLLFALFRGLGAGVRLAWWATAVAVCSPLFWFTALRPLSDMTGLAIAVAAQACLLTPLVARGLKTPAHNAGVASASRMWARDSLCARVFRTPGRWLIAGAAFCGLAAGVRAQTVMLTAPLFLAVLVWPRTGSRSVPGCSRSGLPSPVCSSGRFR